ncbi:MAG: SRPBCC family protein [Stackebrandtia sp.]
MSENTLQLTHIPDVKAGMLVRRPPAEVFQAFVDPAVTTKFWFTKSSGKMTPGARLRWDWEMYGASAQVRVDEVVEHSRIRYAWGDEDKLVPVELRFTPWEGDATYVEVVESVLGGDGDAVVSHVADSVEGYVVVLCGLKALLERDVVLNAVGDVHPGAAK